MPSIAIRTAAACLSSLCIILTLGCAQSFDMPSAETPAVVSIGAIAGHVHGGNQPVTGAHVYIFAAGTGGYAGNGIAASTANASVSLMASVTTGTYPTAYDSTLKAYYVTTDTKGNFGLGGDYTCTAGQQVYLYILGGNPGAGTNTAAAFLAVLGQCPTTGGTLASVAPYVWVNEVSTVAAAYAFAGFATDAVHVSDDEAVSGNTTATLAKTGMANAFANAANIASLATGVALTTTPAANGTVPQARINSLANSLATCVNGVTGSASCTSLFSYAPADGNLSNTATGNIPTDTASAAISIAHHPGISTSNTANIYNLATTNPPFQAALTSAPNDWTLQLAFTGGGLAAAKTIAIDGLGNVWANNTNSLTKLSPLGAAISTSSGYIVGQSGTTFAPWQVAIDSSNNAWTTNQAYGTISKLSSTGTILSGNTGFVLGNQEGYFLRGLAIDGSDNVWSVNNINYTASCGCIPALDEMDNNGNVKSGTYGFSGGGLDAPEGIAIDSSGNAWASDYTGLSVSKISSTGAPISPSSGGQSGLGGYQTPANWNPLAVAIDASNNAWVADLSGENVIVYNSVGTVVSTANGYFGTSLASPAGLAIDGGGNAWVAGGSAVTELSSTGAFLSGSGYTGAGTAGLAIDQSGNVWTVSGSTVVELLGAANPVVVPLGVGVKYNKLGTRP